MAINVIGVAGSMSTTDFAVLGRDVMNAETANDVSAGLSVSPGAGSRQVVVTSGRSVQAFTRATLDTDTTVTLAANSSGLPRIDVVCMQVDWFNGTAPTSASNAGSIHVIQGTPAASPTAPAVTHDPGNLWQTALAEVTVANGAGVLAATAVKDVRPTGASSASSVTSVAVTLPGAWSIPAATPLTLEKVNGIAYLSGRFTRLTGSIAPGTAALFGDTAIIPSGFRPTRTANVLYSSDGTSSSGDYGHITIQSDGTATLNVLTGTVAVNQTLRIVNATWVVA